MYSVTACARFTEEPRQRKTIADDGGSRASPSHGIRITILAGLLDWVASIWGRLSPDADETLAGWYR
jgi:hypothetical protein